MKTLILLTTLFLLSCGDDNLSKVERLSGFRVLAIEASNSEVSPGDALPSLSLHLVDNVARNIPTDVAICLDPGISFGAEPSCEGVPGTQTSSLTINTGGFTVTGGEVNYGIIPFSAPINVPGTILDGRSLQEAINGVAVIVHFTFNLGDKKVEAFKRIVATSRTQKNLNPQFAGPILKNGTTFTTNLRKNDELSIGVNAPETYTYVAVDGEVINRTETLSLAWYTTSGEFNRPKARPDQSVKYLKNGVTGSELIIVIVRDERGGVKSLVQQIPF
jgi:hypothetical protein